MQKRFFSALIFAAAFAVIFAACGHVKTDDVDSNDGKSQVEGAGGGALNDDFLRFNAELAEINYDINLSLGHFMRPLYAPWILKTVVGFELSSISDEVCSALSSARIDSTFNKTHCKSGTRTIASKDLTKPHPALTVKVDKCKSRNDYEHTGEVMVQFFASASDDLLSFTMDFLTDYNISKDGKTDTIAKGTKILITKQGEWEYYDYNETNSRGFTFGAQVAEVTLSSQKPKGNVCLSSGFLPSLDKNGKPTGKKLYIDPLYADCSSRFLGTEWNGSGIKSSYKIQLLGKDAYATRVFITAKAKETHIEDRDDPDASKEHNTSFYVPHLYEPLFYK